MKKKILIVAMAAMLVMVLGLAACASDKSPDDVKKELETAGYSVTMLGAGTDFKQLTASKGTSLLNVAYYSKNKTLFDAAKSAGELLGQTVKVKGNWLYYGDSAFVTAIEGIL